MAIRKTWVIALIFACLLASPTAHAMYKADSAKGNPLVVATGRGCSGAVIAPRLVALAAHCTYEEGLSGIFEPGGKQTIDPTSKLCGNSCGGFNVQGDYAKAVARLVPPGDYKDNRALDIAIWVLDRDVVVPSNLKIATKSDVERFKANRATIIEYGYGQTGAKDFPEFPSTGKLIFSPEGTIMEGVQALASQGYTQFTATGSWTACSGDSGGPFYVEENGINYYLGNLVGVSVQGCFSEVTSAPLMVMNMLSSHLDLLEEANAFVAKLKAAEAEKAAAEKVAADKVAASKKTLICAKGKTIKKVTGSHPKCPKGFVAKK